MNGSNLFFIADVCKSYKESEDAEVRVKLALNIWSGGRKEKKFFNLHNLLKISLSKFSHSSLLIFDD